MRNKQCDIIYEMREIFLNYNIFNSIEVYEVCDFILIDKKILLLLYLYKLNSNIKKQKLSLLFFSKIKVLLG